MRNASSIRIVLANSSLIGYPEAGGLWMCFLQNFFGLHALGHDVFWLEIVHSSGDPKKDERRREIFFERLTEQGLRDRCIVLQNPEKTWTQTIEEAAVFGRSPAELRELIESADLLWNFAYALRPPLLYSFRRRVFLDGDPGLTQVSAQSWNMGQKDHHVFLTVGSKVSDSDCPVPTLGLQWHRFPPIAFLPLWNVKPDPGAAAPFTSVTQWNWKEIWDDPALSISKRLAYLRYQELPRRTGRPFELAANIHSDDQTGDRELLRRHGWQLVHPHEVAGTFSQYGEFIRHSRAELCCPKPIYREKRTGWLSDRSACYLATGRPVLAEDTGFSDHYSPGAGLLAFKDMEQAVALVREVDGDYERHSRAAREFAEDVLDSQKILPRMLAACA